MIPALVLVFVVVVAALAVRGGLHAMVLRGFRAPRLPHADLPDMPGAARAVQVPTAGGKRLFAWHLPAPSDADAPAVVVMHGWGANAAMLLQLARPLQAQGWHVLLPDARGHGRSDDEAFMSLPRFAEDIEAALDWLRQQPGVDITRLAVIGHSVGAGAALLTATRRNDLSAVVSVSAFAHPREMMRRWLDRRRVPYPLLGWYVLRHVEHVIGAKFDDFAPLATVARARCPVLLIHGIDDTTVSFRDAERLVAAGRPGGVQYIAVSGGHDPSTAIEDYMPRLIEFVRSCPSVNQTRDTPRITSDWPMKFPDFTGQS